jgi:prepilin-type N-terminal cleavage/methylation domain-containing protein
LKTQIRSITTDARGFTLVEIMTVCIIIGVLVAMGIPNFIQLQDRAREASVKANMHTIQLALEDFAVQTVGVYPDNGASTTPGGETVEDLCPKGAYPENPFTAAPTVVSWDADPANPGEIGVNPATVSDYTIKGHGKSFMLFLELHPGF